MSLLKVKDNTTYNKDVFSSVGSLVSKITDKTLGQLEREGLFVFPELANDIEGLSIEQVLLQSINDKYQTGNVMGYIGLGNERLIVESRFSDNEEDYFLQYMLEHVLEMPNIVDLHTDANNDNKLFNYLLFLFPRYLKTASRKGMLKEYVHRRYNDSHVKRVIDISRHIEKNTPFVGDIAYSCREFSYDNNLMELIRHTIEYIKNKPYGSKVLSAIKNEVKQVIEVTPNYRSSNRKKIVEFNRRSPIKHAYYREYLALQRLCILILSHQKHQIGSGARQIYGLPFDGAWLWEEYVANLIAEDFHHPSNKARSRAQRLFEKGVGLIYPDFLNRSPLSRVIADAKYKPASNIGNRDYLQVLAYMFRFDAEKGFYLYPEAADNSSVKLRMNRGSTYEGNVYPRDNVFIVKHGLRVPTLASCYEDFVSRMKVSEREFRALLVDALKAKETEQLGAVVR